MRLAALGEHFGWPRAELLAMNESEIEFWLGAIASLRGFQGP